MENSMERIAAAVIEGQSQSPRFIQQQLSSLHKALVKARPELQSAVTNDTRLSAVEFEVQYALTLQNITNSFLDSNFDVAMEQEYKLARSENSADNLIPYGIVYIQPAKYNVVYSTIAAIAAAVLGGNCVILEMPKTLSETSKILTTAISTALNHNTFIVVENPINFAALSNKCIRLYASPDSGNPTAENSLIPPTTRSIAIVDRYADMQQAALSLLRSRFTFGGQSPIAPDLVLVNEFRIKEFCRALAEKSTKYFAAQLTENGGFDPATAAKARATRTSMTELDQGGAEIINSGSKGCIARVSDRKSKLLKKHVHEPLLIIHSVTSLDDAIDFANSLSDNKAFAALHVFGSPEVGKYTSQFINSHLSCVNDIPVELLVAPLTPIGFPTRLGSPYRKEMFSRPNPQYINFSDTNSQIAALVDDNNQVEATKLRKKAETIKADVKQAPGHAIGHFEQGLLLGLILAVTSLSVGSVALWRYGLPAIAASRR